MEARLNPLQGDRFQPTGFADLGPARYQAPEQNGTPIEMLLVESPQSVANRMELACCKEDKRTLLDDLDGLPYVKSTYAGELLTTSYLEAHRLSSPYLLNMEWAQELAGDMNLRDDFPLNDQKIHKTLFKYDPCSLLHGVWLSLKDYKNVFSGGRVRVVRSLSGFIEARDVRVAENGGTKFDRNFARTEEGASAETGYGTLPFHRTEFTAEEIIAYFNLDLAQLRGYSLETEATGLLLALALLKIRRFLTNGLRLRTACDLKVVDGPKATFPASFIVPDEATLIQAVKDGIEACRGAGLFAVPPVKEVVWGRPSSKPTEAELPIGAAPIEIPDELKEKLDFKKGTKKKGPRIVFKEGLDAALAAKIKEVFSGRSDIAQALHEQLQAKGSADASDDDDVTG
jgi:CRISPR-associated protein Csb1